MSEDSWDGGSPWLFLFGLVVFLGSGLLFVADLIRGIDVVRSVGANAAGAALLIAWAAQDTYANPDSEVASLGGATGTALLLYGLYLLGAGALITVTALVHDRPRLGFAYLGLAIVTVVVGYLIFPKEAVLETDESEGDRTSSSQDVDDQQPSGQNEELGDQPGGE